MPEPAVDAGARSLGRFDKVATGSYFARMATTKTVGIKDLKNNLSAYLRDVRRGTRIVVSDRDTVVAELHEPGKAYAIDEPWGPILAEWIHGGVVTAPSRNTEKPPKSPVVAADGTSLRLLRQDRGDVRG